ncbi:MAG: GWxTD domain-containing protein [Acidobacteria bacterium]|nr:GWxTD domain-containing protein [Acidobacteriota bacterium]
MLPEEQEAWNKVASKEQADAFIAEFWRKRGDAFRNDLLSRVEFADKQFGLGENRGSRTAQGKVFVILGSPTTQRLERNPNSATLNGVMGANSVEQGAQQQTTWIYRKDRLAQDIPNPLPELTVKFQTDTRRMQQDIDNPGLVEPYIHRVAQFRSRQAIDAMASGTPAPVATIAPTVGSMPGQDPLWNAPEGLNGVLFTGEPYISPTEETMYSASFYVPKAATAFEPVKNALFVTLVKDANGKIVANQREQVPLASYDDASGDRFVARGLALPAGKYTGDFALFTPEGTTLLANHRFDFEVPEKTAPRAAALYLTSRIDMLENQQPYDPFTFVAQRYVVKADRKFKANDKIGFFTVIANPNAAPEPSMTMKMTFTKDGQPSFKTPAEPAPLVQTGPHTYLIGNQFEAGTFKPGHYTMEVLLRDLKADQATTQPYVLKTDFDVLP